MSDRRRGALGAIRVVGRVRGVARAPCRRRPEISRILMVRDGPETIAVWAFSVSPLSTIATPALQERQRGGAAVMLFFAVFTAEISGGVAVIRHSAPGEARKSAAEHSLLRCSSREISAKTVKLAFQATATELRSNRRRQSHDQSKRALSEQ